MLVGEKEQCKVTDFGLARDVQEEGFYEKKTKVSDSFLTLSYTGFFGLAGHGGDGIHHTFITLVLFDGFELNLVQ